MLIETQNELDAFLAKAMAAPFVTVDTEFLREKTYYPKLCLIQIGLPSGEAVAVDPLADGIALDGVFDLLRHKDVLKVFHAARQDLEIFYRMMGEVPAPFFDTQIAAMVCGYGDSVGYESLVRNLTDKTIDKAVQFTNWAQRPLTKQQLNYALGDVTHLVEIYEKLLTDLETRDRVDWVFEEEEILADPATYENPHDKAWERVKIKSNKPVVMAVLQALAGWRERQAQKKDIPRNWIMRDDTLADMAAQSPTSTQKLKKIRNMPQEVAEGPTGQKLLKLIEEAKNSNPKDWPSKPKRQPVPPKVAATIDILKMLLKITAANYEVAAKLIANAEDLEAIARHGKSADVSAMHGWRLEIFGQYALQLKNGEISIGFKDGEIVRYKVKKTSELAEDV